MFKISLTGNEIKVKAKSSAKILKVIVYQEKLSFPSVYRNCANCQGKVQCL